MNYKPSVLIISLDESLLTNSGLGDSAQRFIEYSKYTKTITVIIPTNQRHKPLNNKYFQTIPIYGTSKLHSYLSLISYINQNKHYDLIITNDPVLGFISILARGVSYQPKIQINIFGLVIANKNWWLERFSNWILAPIWILSIYFADSIRTDTNHDRKTLINFFKIPKSKIISVPVVPNPKIIKELVNAKPSPSLKKQLAGNKKLILTIGHFVPNKDYKTLVQTANYLSKINQNFHWLIVGSGPLQQNIKKEVENLKLSQFITIKNSLPYDKLPTLYKTADIFVSTSYLEGLPRVFIESAIANLPLVATSTAGAIDFVYIHTINSVSPVKDPKKLAAQINSMLMNSKRINQKNQNDIEKIRLHFDFNTNLVKLAKSWQNLFKNQNFVA